MTMSNKLSQDVSVFVINDAFTANLFIAYRLTENIFLKQIYFRFICND